LGELKVAAVTSANIEAFMNAATAGSARRLVTLTSAIFSYAVKQKMRSDNPCRGVEKPQDRRKERRLSAEEYRQLGQALGTAQSAAGDIFLGLALSGWRASEMRLLRRSEIDLARCCATLSDTKTGKSLRPLSSALIAIITRQDSAASEFVFPLKTSNIHHHWAALQMPKDCTMHTLRHSFASLAADLGFGDSIVGGMIGHRQSSITSRYLHLNDAIIKAADATAARTLELIGATNG
jgi:integrase